MAKAPAAAPAAATPGAPAAPAPAERRGGAAARRKDKRTVPHGVANIQASFNNTVISICDPDGNVVIAWDSFGQDGSTTGIYARRYGRFDPDGLDVDAKNGNGVFEPGESVEVATEWHNFMHQGVGAVTGTASAFDGPAGATYTIVDGTANYGPVSAGETATCELFEDCFAMSVSAPATRPALHWDARFTETLTLAGRSHTWLLHIGASFADSRSGRLVNRKRALRAGRSYR